MRHNPARPARSTRLVSLLLSTIAAFAAIALLLTTPALGVARDGFESMSASLTQLADQAAPPETLQLETEGVDAAGGALVVTAATSTSTRKAVRIAKRVGNKVGARIAERMVDESASADVTREARVAAKKAARRAAVKAAREFADSRGPKSIRRIAGRAARPAARQAVSASLTSAGETTAIQASSAFQDEIVTLVNRARASAGLDPVSSNAKLARAAKRHSADQAEMQTMSHEGSDGTRGGDRILDEGYRWCRWGENVAYGYTTPQAVFDAWMDSPSHRANILTDDFVHLGLATAEGENGVLYWTQEFGVLC